MGNTSSSGNLVNAGNCDPKGANVNNDQPDNSNDNLGALVVRNFLLAWIKGLPERRPFRSNFPCRFDPATQHSSDLVDHLLNQTIFLDVHDLQILRKA